MSVGYRVVGWNRQKVRYDLLLALLAASWLLVFAGVTLQLHPSATAESILIRGLGTLALLLLHLALAIGPLARLDRRFLPLLYNRRHLGVATALVGLLHGALVTVQYHALGDTSPLVSLLSASRRWERIADWPFELFGVVGLLVLLVMAATSHDLWLAQLTAPVWKRLHLLVYPAYALLVLHVAAGALQDETSPVLAGALALGVGTVLGLHLLAGWRERGGDREQPPPAGGEEARIDGAAVAERWVDAGPVATIPEGRARTVTIAGERVAVYRYDGKVSAISNVCRHQNGPLGEGRVIDGCVTCPWHGYQYRPDDGCSPPPFHERVPTFRVRIVAGRVEVAARPLPAGTRVEPAVLDASAGGDEMPRGPIASEWWATSSGAPAPAKAVDRAPAAADDELYVGYLPTAPPPLERFLRRLAGGLLLAVVTLAAALGAAQRTFAPSAFDWQRPQRFVGTLWTAPLPLLVVARSDGAEALLLSAPGKFGAADLVVPFAGTLVSLEATVATRGGQRLLEIVPGSIRAAAADSLAALANGPLAAGSAPAAPDADVTAADWTPLGQLELAGEIVDGKCFLGVMNPGEGKIHRGCAVRCLSGGAPALLAVRLPDGSRRQLPLVGRSGPLVPAILDRIAEPVRVRGELGRGPGGLLVLRTEPEAIVRLAP